MLNVVAGPTHGDDLHAQRLAAARRRDQRAATRHGTARKGRRALAASRTCWVDDAPEEDPRWWLCRRACAPRPPRSPPSVPAPPSRRCPARARRPPRPAPAPADTGDHRPRRRPPAPESSRARRSPRRPTAAPRPSPTRPKRRAPLGRQRLPSEAAEEAERSRSRRKAPVAAAASPTRPVEIPSIPSSSCAATGVPPVADPDLPGGPRPSTGSAPRARDPRRDQRDRDRLRHQPQRLLGRGARAGCSSCPRPGRRTASTPTATASATPTTPKTRSTPPPATSAPSGMPADTYGAIFAYNHADWYVADVLANAACYAGCRQHHGRWLSLDAAAAGAQLPARPRNWRDAVPDDYLTAFESAAARYELGRRRRLGADRGLPPRVELRARDGQETARRNSGRSVSTARVEDLCGRRRRGRQVSAAPTPTTRPPPWRA